MHFCFKYDCKPTAKQISNQYLTCSSLYEECRLCAHRTLFEQLHHPSMSRCSYRLLVHLQDQVSFDQP